MEKQEFRFTGRTINHIKKLKYREHIGKIRLSGFWRAIAKEKAASQQNENSWRRQSYSRKPMTS
jgi:hypothetical protein